MSAGREVEWSWTVGQVEDHIRALPIWTGTVELERLWGGLQNRSWVAVDGADRYVVRQAGDLRDIWGTASATRTAMSAAAEIGISPRIVYDERLLAVSEFIDGRSFGPEDLHREDNVREVVRLLKLLQAKAPEVVHYPIDYFWPFDATRQAAWIARRLGWKRVDEADRMVEICNRFEPLFGPYMPALCHADLAFVNVMEERASGRLWIIDYDLCGWGPPEWDVAEMCAYAKTPDAIDRFALGCFFGPLPEAEFEERLHKHRALKMTSFARIALLCGIIASGSSLLAPDELARSMAALFGEIGETEPSVESLADYEVEGFWEMWEKYADAY